jgi:Mg2+ and Co2+ transporter CorA
MGVMFRVMELRDGKVDLFEGTEHVGPPPAGVVRWVDLRTQDESQLELLRERFDFHPLAIEDCAHEDQRPKLEEYKDHIFLVTQGFACAGTRVEELELHELHASSASATWSPSTSAHRGARQDLAAAVGRAPSCSSAASTSSTT